MKQRNNLFISFFLLWIFPLEKIFRYSESLALGIALLLFCLTIQMFDIIQDAFDYVCSDEKKQFFYSNSRKQENYWKFWLIVFGIMLFAGLLVSIIWYPGTVVSDNVQMYENSIDFGNTESRSDVISFFYVCIMHFLFALTSNYYVLTIIMVFLFSVVWASLMMTLYSFGIKYPIIIVVTLLWLLIPSDLLMLISTFKDIPFTLFLLVYLDMLIKYLFLKLSSPVNQKHFEPI